MPPAVAPPLESITSSSLAAVLCGHWAISEEGYQQILAIATRDALFADIRQLALQARDGKPLDNTRTTRVRDGVAIIPMQGSMFRHGGMFSSISGATSYEAIMRDLTVALESPEVRAIMFDVDSPGGEVHGCAELAAAIFAARSVKPVWAFVSGNCASAAYWLSSNCTRIVANRSALSGSIGVRTLMTDRSKADEQQGIVKYDIVSSQSPLKAFDAGSEEDRKRMKALLSQQAEVFIADVARGRGVAASVVGRNYGKGDVLIAADALDAGMIDAVGDFESTLAELAATGRSTTTPGVRMPPTAHAGMKDGTCTQCSKKMAEDEDLFCKGCKGSASKAHTEAHSGILAVTGETDVSKALAMIAGWKQQASENVGLRAELDKRTQESRLAAFDAELAIQHAAGVIPKPVEGAEPHERLKFALTLRGSEKGVDNLRAYAKALGPAVPTGGEVMNPTGSGVVPPLPSSAAGQTPGKGETAVVIKLSDKEKQIASARGLSYDGVTVILTAEDKAMAKKTGIALEEYAKTKAFHQAAITENPEAFRLKRAGSKTQDDNAA